MGTRGDYGVIVDGSFYGVHVHSDGYPQALVPPLAAEMAALSAAERAQLAEQIKQVEWVVPSDAETVARSNGTLAPPQHPDGGWGPDPDFEFQVPRQSRSEVEARIAFMLASRPGNTTTPEVAVPVAVVSQPSLVELARLGTATKTTRPFARRRSPWAVVADLDADEFDVFDARRRRAPRPLGRPYACVPLGDTERLHELARRLLAAMGSMHAPDLPKHLRSTPALLGRSLTDGMTRRPQGYPPLSGPARRQIPQPGTATATADPAATDTRCGRPTKGGRGEPCTQPRPARVGDRCQAGHVRIR